MIEPIIIGRITGNEDILDRRLLEDQLVDITDMNVAVVLYLQSSTGEFRPERRRQHQQGQKWQKRTPGESG